MSTPTPDENQPLCDALQRDAARVPKPAFDPALHHATMRRIRELAEPSSPKWNWVPLMTSAAVVALLACIAWWQMRSLPENKIAAQAQPEQMKHSSVPTPSPVIAAPRASLLAYQTAASEGDAALFAMLDRDASTLLPPSAPAFQNPLR